MQPSASNPAPRGPVDTFRAFLARPAWLHLVCLGGLMAVLGLRWSAGVLDPAPRPDELAYFQAFAAVRAGGSPYDVEAYLYPPPFAYAGAAATAWLGDGAVLALERALNLASIAALLWAGFGFLPWSLPARLAGAAAVGLVSPGVRVALLWGNISPSISLALCAGLLLWRRRPLVAGLVLGLAGVIKPLTPMALAVLFVHRPAAGGRRHLLAAATGMLAGAAVALATPHLGDYLRMSQVDHDNPRNVSLIRVALSLGFELDALVLLLGVGLLGSAWLRSRPLGQLGVGAVAIALAMLALPVVWDHTLLATLPLQGAALAAVFYGQALGPTTTGPTTPDDLRRRRLLRAVAVIAALGLLFSGAGDGIDARFVVLRAVYAVLTLALPLVLAAFVVREDARSR